MKRYEPKKKGAKNYFKHGKERKIESLHKRYIQNNQYKLGVNNIARILHFTGCPKTGHVNMDMTIKHFN